MNSGRGKTDLQILIEWILFFGGVFMAMIAVGTFALPFAVILLLIGLPPFLCQIGALFLAGGFFWLLIEMYGDERAR